MATDRQNPESAPDFSQIDPDTLDKAIRAYVGDVTEVIPAKTDFLLDALPDVRFCSRYGYMQFMAPTWNVTEKTPQSDEKENK